MERAITKGNAWEILLLRSSCGGVLLPCQASAPLPHLDHRTA